MNDKCLNIQTFALKEYLFLKVKAILSGIKYVQLVKPAIGDQSEQSNFQNCTDTSEGAKVAKKMRDLKRQRREDDQFM